MWLFGRSLPFEIEDEILRHAGPLARWLCRINPSDDDESNLTESDAVTLWRDAFRCCYTVLDDMPMSTLGDLEIEDWCTISSKEYYRFLWREMEVEHLVPFQIPKYVSQHFWGDSEPFHPLIHVALRNCWTDEFSHRAFRNVLWRAVRAAAHGHMALLEMMLNDAVEQIDVVEVKARALATMGQYPMASLYEIAAQFDRLDVLRLLIPYLPREQTAVDFLIHESFLAAVGHGNLEMLRLLLELSRPERRQDILRRSLMRAAQDGQTSIARWIIEVKVWDDDEDDMVFEMAVIWGHLSIVQLLYGQVARYRNRSTLQSALDSARESRYDTANVAQWLNEQITGM